MQEDKTEEREKGNIGEKEIAQPQEHRIEENNNRKTGKTNNKGGMSDNMNNEDNIEKNNGKEGSTKNINEDDKGNDGNEEKPAKGVRINKQEIYDKLAELRKQITELRKKLNDLNSDKEKWYEKRADVGSKIKELILKLKEAKRKRDELTSKVKKLKEERQKNSDKLKELIQRFNKIRSEREGLSKKKGIKISPGELKKQIEELELKFETEALSPEKEKKLMKLIKQKKTEYKEIKSVAGVWDEEAELNKEIKRIKRENQERHLKIQVIAAESQRRHEDLLGYAKEIDSLRLKENEAQNNFLKFRGEILGLNKELKEKLREANKLHGLIKEEKKEKFLEEKAKEGEILKKKKEIVLDKIKNKKKLTTEDLLVFQGMEKEN